LFVDLAPYPTVYFNILCVVIRPLGQVTETWELVEKDLDEHGIDINVEPLLLPNLKKLNTAIQMHETKLWPFLVQVSSSSRKFSPLPRLLFNSSVSRVAAYLHYS
jgi:hypothetical protein